MKNRNLKLGIIGGNGRMGQWFKRFFELNGFEVIISDINTKLTNKELVKKSDAVVISVPIGKTVEVIEEIIPFTRKEQILIDLTSIKTPVAKAMEKSECEILSIHPMFSHHIDSIKNQTVIICNVRKRELSKRIEDAFKNAKAAVKYSTPKEHDKIMATIQGLTHFNAIVLANTLKELKVDVSESLMYTSPIYKIRMGMIGRIMAQDARLYAEIESLNPDTKESVKELIKSSKKLFEKIENNDVEGFIDFFKEASDYLGDFKGSAMKDSNYLIKKISEIKKED